MAKFLAIFSILSGTASIVGLIHILMDEQRLRFKKVFIGAFILAVLLSLYVLFVPGNYFENSVQSKLQTYSNEKSTATMIQKGEFSFSGMREYTVMFPEPFSKTPEVEVINVNRHDYVPYVNSVTPFQVIFRRNESGFTLTPFSFQDFVWVAKGEAMVPEQ